MNKQARSKMKSQKYSHQYWMAEALALGSRFKAQGLEVPVVAFVVKDSQLISKAINQVETNNDATLHAEVVAIREASKALGNWRLNDCTLYVTLEPCLMCAGAILNSRISKVIFGAYDLSKGACGSVINVLTNVDKGSVDVIGGICEEKASELLRDFFKEQRTKSDIAY